jgi:protease I
MPGTLQGKRIAFLVANEGVEQVELTEPWRTVEAAGGEPVLVSLEAGEVQAFNHLDKGDRFRVDQRVADTDASAFDALVLPGGVANPDELRTHPHAVRFVREFGDRGDPIAVICHGPWTMIDAGLVRGRRLASWPSLRTDITNAGGEWVDAPVVVDRSGPSTIVSSRWPDDLPAFIEQMVEVFATAPANARS